jgi:hypothetical protein
MFFLEFAQSPDYDFFNIFYDLFPCSFGTLLPMFQKKKKTKQCVWTMCGYKPLNTPNISGVWQIRKCSLVSLKAHQPRQGQSPLAG